MSHVLATRRLWRTGLAAAGLAALGNLGIYGIALALGVPFDFPLGFTGAPATTGGLAVGVVVNSVVPFVIGLGIATLVARRRPERLRAMQIAAVVVTVLSFLQPALLDADVATRVALATMHPLPGVAFVLALQRVLREQGSAREARSVSVAA